MPAPKCHLFHASLYYVSRKVLLVSSVGDWMPQFHRRDKIATRIRLDKPQTNRIFFPLIPSPLERHPTPFAHPSDSLPNHAPLHPISYSASRSCPLTNFRFSPPTSTCDPFQSPPCPLVLCRRVPERIRRKLFPLRNQEDRSARSRYPRLHFIGPDVRRELHDSKRVQSRSSYRLCRAASQTPRTSTRFCCQFWLCECCDR